MAAWIILYKLEVTFPVHISQHHLLNVFYNIYAHVSIFVNKEGNIKSWHIS